MPASNSGLVSDDEEAEFAIDIRKLYSVQVPAMSLGQKEAIKPVLQASRNKDPSVTVSHYDSEGKRHFYGLDNGAVCFWPITQQSSNTSRFVGSHKGPVTAICTPRKHDGELGKAGLIVTASVDSSIKIWDYQGKVILEPAVCVQTLYGHAGTVTSLVILGDYLLSSSTDNTIKVWRQEEGRGQLVYPWFELQATVSALEGWVRCMTYGTSGDHGDLGALFAADESGGLIKIVPHPLWDDSAQRLSTRMEFKVEDRLAKIHDRGVSCIRYVPKWELVLTLAYDMCLRAYDTTTNTVRFCWENEERCQFTALEVELEYDEVLACDTGGTLSIFSVRTGRLMATKRLVPGQHPRTMAAAGAGATSQPHHIQAITKVLGRQLYAVLTGREYTLWQIEHELEYNMARGGHEKAVISLHACSGVVAGAAGEHDFRIFSASIDNTMRLWDPYDMACIRVLEESISEVSAMTYYEGWNIVVTGHDNGDIRLWNLDSSSTTTLRQHTNTVTALTLALIHRNEELLISTGYDGWVVLWDIRSLRGEAPHMVGKFKAGGPDAPSRRRLDLDAPSLGGGDGAGDAVGRNASLLSCMSLQLRAPSVPGIEASGSNSGLAVNVSMTGSGASSDGTSAAAETLQRVLGAPEVEVLALRFDPMKKVIITAGNNKAIRVWSASGYMYMGCHVGHKEPVTCLALDSNFLFSGSDDCSICLWDTVPAVVAKHSAHGGGAAPAAGGRSLQNQMTVMVNGFVGRPLKVLQGHSRSVTGLDVLPSSGNLVSCSLDGSLLVWDYISGEVLHKYQHDVEEFRCLALRHDRPEMLVGTTQANILRYTVTETAAGTVGRSTTGANAPHAWAPAGRAPSMGGQTSFGSHDPSRDPTLEVH